MNVGSQWKGEGREWVPPYASAFTFYQPGQSAAQDGELQGKQGSVRWLLAPGSSQEHGPRWNSQAGGSTCTCPARGPHPAFLYAAAMWNVRTSAMRITQISQEEQWVFLDPLDSGMDTCGDKNRRGRQTSTWTSPSPLGRQTLHSPRNRQPTLHTSTWVSIRRSKGGEGCFPTPFRKIREEKSFCLQYLYIDWLCQACGWWWPQI